MTSAPLISCLMVTRDRVQLAERAIACFLAQTWPERELVIVDDGDTDYAPMIAGFGEAAANVRYQRLTDGVPRTLGELRNLAIDLAEGGWCAQWDDDEWYHPDRLAVQWGALRPGDVGCALRWTLIDPGTSIAGDLRAADHSTVPASGFRRLFRADCGVATPGTILHRHDAARYPHLRRGEDSVFLDGLRHAGPVAVLGREWSHLFVRCYHGANTWGAEHFRKRLHRRVRDWPSYLSSRLLWRDLSRHTAFALSPSERATAEALSNWSPMARRSA